MLLLFQIIKNIVFNRNIHSSTQLGRWNINYSNIVINRKIDLANQDNCSYLSLKNKDTVLNEENLTKIAK
jgi:hypothetical protein